MDAEELDRLTHAAIGALAPILGGKPPEIQGMILAWVTAWWLAGHFDPDDTVGLRKALLDQHTAGVRDMVPIAERELLSRIKAH